MVKKKTIPSKKKYDAANPTFAFRPDEQIRAFVDGHVATTGMTRSEVIAGFLHTAMTGRAKDKEIWQAGFEAGRQSPVMYRWPCRSCKQQFDYDLRDAGDVIALKAQNISRCSHPKDGRPKHASQSSYV